MRHIYIRTFAYNAEKTLERAVDSILNQTYPYFTYYLLDNGSTDKTRQLIEMYAAKDNRIVPFYTNKNMEFGIEHEDFIKLPKNIPDNDLFCVLDADDEYEPNFFDDAVKFLEENKLDIVCCGSRFINSVDGSLLGKRSLNEPVIIEGRGFAELFPYYHVFMRTVWGKLAAGNCVRNFVTKRDPNDKSVPDYGIDTWDMISAFRCATRIGIMPGQAHRYYISPKSSSYYLSSKRIVSDKLLYEATVDYLKQYGAISHRNWDFIYAVYMNALKDTLNVLLNVKISVSEKLRGLVEMLTCDYTRQLAAWDNFGAYIGQAKEMQHTRTEFFIKVANWLLELENVPDEQVEDFCDIGEFVCAAVEFSDGWIFFKKQRVSYLIEQRRSDEARDKLRELEELLPYDEDVLTFGKILNNL